MTLWMRLAMTLKSVYGSLSNTREKDLNSTKYNGILLLKDVVHIVSADK